MTNVKEWLQIFKEVESGANRDLASQKSKAESEKSKEIAEKNLLEDLAEI